MHCVIKNKSHWPRSVVKTSLKCDVFSEWQNALHSEVIPKHAYCLPGKGLTNASNRKRSQELFYLFNPLSNLTPGTLTCTYISNLMFWKGPGAGITGVAHWGQGREESGKEENRLNVNLLLLMAFLQFHHLWLSSLLQLLYMNTYPPHSQVFLIKSSWQMTPMGRDRGPNGRKKAKWNYVLKKDIYYSSSLENEMCSASLNW